MKSIKDEVMKTYKNDMIIFEMSKVQDPKVQTILKRIFDTFDTYDYMDIFEDCDYGYNNDDLAAEEQHDCIMGMDEEEIELAHFTAGYIEGLKFALNVLKGETK